jgi:NADH-quinone oxidoreductase subunit J
LIAILLFAGIALIFVNWQGFTTTTSDLANPGGRIVQLGLALVSPDQYLLPFELASVLLVAAMIGAIFVAGEKKQ